MSHLSKYLPYIFACALFFVGRLSAPDNLKDLEKKFEQERKVYQDKITSLNVALNDKDKAGKAIREKRYHDSLKTSIDLQAKDRVISKLHKENEKINLSRSTASELDSIRTIILRSVN